MQRSHKKYKGSIVDLARDLIWAQWNRLGLNGTGGVNRYSVDIEAAIIAAGYGSRLDGRLYEGVRSWLELYGDIVNKERLATLILKKDDEWIARFLGALLENMDAVLWRGVIKQCRNMCSSSWKEAPLLISAVADTWCDKDPIMLKWGIICARSTPKRKMLEHDAILRNNALIRYRYLYGTCIRADVIYLLAVSRVLLTSVHLADLLCCHLSTIHRIQKDLEKGGWAVKELQFIKGSEGCDIGIIDWVKINSFVSALLKLGDELEAEDNEMILKTRIQTFQADHFPAIFLDHYIEPPWAYGTALEPLEKHSVERMFAMVEETARLFYGVITTQ